MARQTIFRDASLRGLTKKQIRDIPVVTPNFEWQVTYQKELPCIITDIQFLEGFYNANAREQEEKLRDLWKSVKEYRKKRQKGLIID